MLCDPFPSSAHCAGRPFSADGRFPLVLCGGSLIRCEKAPLFHGESRSLREGAGRSGLVSCTLRQVRLGGKISETRGMPCKLRARGCYMEGMWVSEGCE